MPYTIKAVHIEYDTNNKISLVAVLLVSDFKASWVRATFLGDKKNMQLNYYIIHFTNPTMPGQYFHTCYLSKNIQEAVNSFYNHPIYKDCVIIKTEKHNTQNGGE